MGTITTIRDLETFLNTEFKLPLTTITQEQVDWFGKETGDVNPHNAKPTVRFKQAAVQGFFALGLFGGFHLEVCKIPDTDPTNAEIINAKFKNPIYVGQKVLPILKIIFVQNQGERVKAIWDYELQCEDSQVLLKAQIKLLYFLTS